MFWTRVGMTLAACRSILLLAVVLPALPPACAGPIEAAIELKNSQGLRWQLEKRGGRWTLGTFFVHDKPVDAPLASGILALNNIASRQLLWPAATEAKQLDERSARFAGSEKIGDVLVPLRGGRGVEEGPARCHPATPLVRRQGS